MTDPKQQHILLIHPPMAGPAMPPWQPAQTAAHLDALGVSFELCDANLDFLLNHLLTPQHLTVLLNRIFDKKVSSFDSNAESLEADIRNNPQKWLRKAAAVKQSLTALRDDRFFQPELFVTALRDVNALLSLALLAYAPSQFHRGDYFNSALQGWREIESFLENKKENPFLSYCREKLVSKISRSENTLLIICVSTKGQLLAALTIASYSKKLRPSLPVVLQSDQALPIGIQNRVDRIVPTKDPRALGELVFSLSGSDRSPKTVWPDFSRLPLHDYLAPFPVLPFRLPFGHISDHRDSFYAYVAELIQKQNVHGLLFENTALDLAGMSALFDKNKKNDFPLRIGLTLDLSLTPAPDEFTDIAASGVCFIRWRNPQTDIKGFLNTLRQCAKARIWNHVEIPAVADKTLIDELKRHVASNPNIAHSWSHVNTSRLAASIFPIPEDSDVYSQVSRLPGRPFGHYLQEPAHLLLYLQHQGFNTVRQWQFRDDPPVIYTLGRGITYRYMKPADLPSGYLDEICRMIEAGGSVGTKWVRHNLKRAFLIGVAMEEGVIVGNSSLKHPRAEYLKAVSQQSGLDLNRFLERGYTSVRPEYRGLGIGTLLLKGLTARAGNRKVFSIIGSDNVAAQKMAIRNNTKQVATFYSDRAQKELGVWIPAHMLDSVHP